jgi:hypothetical protein
VIHNEKCRQAVVVAESFADGLKSGPALNEAYNEAANVAISAASKAATSSAESPFRVSEAVDVSTGCFDAVLIPSVDTVISANEIESAWASHAGQQAKLLRDIFGNPFRPVVADPSWLTPTVHDLAAAIYADRAFDRLPILADALEEAGCDNTDVLGHCRGPGPHVRGCWVVDLILGKS